MKEYILAMFGFDYESRKEMFTKEGNKFNIGLILFISAIGFSEYIVEFMTKIIEKIIF